MEIWETIINTQNIAIVLLAGGLAWMTKQYLNEKTENRRLNDELYNTYKEQLRRILEATRILEEVTKSKQRPENL